jgi:uncharacterized protein YlaI
MISKICDKVSGIAAEKSFGRTLRNVPNTIYANGEYFTRMTEEISSKTHTY